MSRFGLIARGDRGGVAAQTWEVYRKLSPAKVLLVDLGAAGRGPTDPSLYSGARALRVTHGLPTPADVKWLTTDVDSVFTVEVIYGKQTRRVLADRGTRVVLQANPELFVADDFVGVNLTVVLPTGWEADRFPAGTRVLPVPVDTVALTPSRPSGEPHIFHPAGAAMADRNGTRLVFGALRSMRHEATVLVANRMSQPRRRMNGVRLAPLPDHPTYLGHWTDHDFDVVVLPRRYGGLSLPMQEAAACGLPIVTLDLDPQRAWVPEPGLLPAKARAPARVVMKGGTFSVHNASPQGLARVLDAFVADSTLRAECGAAARAHAETISWTRLADEYRELLA